MPSPAIAPDAASFKTRRGDADPYLKRLSDLAVEQTGELVHRIGTEGGCFVARVARDAFLVESMSPTRERAAQFQGVYEELVEDVLTWLRSK